MPILCQPGCQAWCDKDAVPALKGCAVRWVSRRGHTTEQLHSLRVAQMVKNPFILLETPVRSLDWEDLLEKGMAIHSSSLRFPWWLRQ